jgi:hypothetical protein
MLKPCERCQGKVMIDRAYCNYGHIELFCIICGKRWEYHRSHPIATAINKLERIRERSVNGIGV